MLVEPMKHRTSGEMCKAYNRLKQWLQNSELPGKITYQTTRDQMNSSMQYGEKALNTKKLCHTYTDKMQQKKE